MGLGEMCHTRHHSTPLSHRTNTPRDPPRRTTDRPIYQLSHYTRLRNNFLSSPCHDRKLLFWCLVYWEAWDNLYGLIHRVPSLIRRMPWKWNIQLHDIKRHGYGGTGGCNWYLHPFTVSWTTHDTPFSHHKQSPPPPPQQQELILK